MKRTIAIFALMVLIFCALSPCRVLAAPEIPGKSGILMDAATGTVLLEQNSHEALAPASVTKVMTLLLIMEAVDSGQIRWEDPVTASEAAAAKGGSQIYLKAGESMTVRDMVKSIAVSSANDCACAMAEFLAGSEEGFVERMNEKAAALGMADTHFVNCTGLDDADSAREHRTSAHDIALMSRELLLQHPGITEFTTIWMDTVRDGTFGLSNTNKMVRFYPGCTGLKTGFTSGAGYCLSASAQRQGMELIAVVMGCDSSKNRFAACKAMLDYGFASYTLYTPALDQAPTVPVRLGQAPLVTAIPAEPVTLLLEKTRAGDVTTELQLEESVEAPVTRGTKLGTMTVKAGDQILRQIPLVAQTPVPRQKWHILVLQLLKQICMAA